MQSMGEVDAKQCIRALDASGCDFTILFWMRNFETLLTSDIGLEFKAFFETQKIGLDKFLSLDYKQGFFQAIRTEINKRGITPVSPLNHVITRGSGGKEKAIVMSKDAKWPHPHQAFCFQTRGSGASLFFIYQCWQDAVIKMVEILDRRGVIFNGELVEVAQIYEHCWGDTRISRFLIDWEAQESWFKGRLKAEDIRACALKFPAWFVRELMRLGAISKQAKVRCAVKDKSRMVEGSGCKVSFHFIFNIAGFPRGSHRLACSKVFENISPLLRRVHETKTYDSLSEDRVNSPWIGVDWRTMSGGHGFSVPFSRKLPLDPTPSLPFTLLITQSEEKMTETPWKDPSPSIGDLGLENSALMMYAASYTTPVASVVSYESALVSEDKRVVGGVVAKRPRALSANHPESPGFLPEWLESELKKRGGFTCNFALPCIQRGEGVFKSLSDHLEASEGLKIAHVKNVPCPAKLYSGQHHIHSSNGVFVAVCDNQVYAACSVCKIRAQEDAKQYIVNGTVQSRFQWFKWAEGDYKHFVDSGSRCCLWLKSEGDSGG